MVPLEHPRLAASSLTGAEEAGCNRGKCLCREQPVALKSQLYTPPGGEGNREPGMLYVPLSVTRGKQFFRSQSRVSLEMRNEPEHQTV